MVYSQRGCTCNANRSEILAAFGIGSWAVISAIAGRLCPKDMGAVGGARKEPGRWASSLSSNGRGDNLQGTDQDGVLRHVAMTSIIRLRALTIAHEVSIEGGKMGTTALGEQRDASRSKAVPSCDYQRDCVY